MAREFSSYAADICNITLKNNDGYQSCPFKNYEKDFGDTKFSYQDSSSTLHIFLNEKL